MSPEAPEGLAEASGGSKAIPDALPEAHIEVEICWLGTNGIDHASDTARFRQIGAILPPSS